MACGFWLNKLANDFAKEDVDKCHIFFQQILENRVNINYSLIHERCITRLKIKLPTNTSRVVSDIGPVKQSSLQTCILNNNVAIIVALFTLLPIGQQHFSRSGIRLYSVVPCVDEKSLSGNSPHLEQMLRLLLLDWLCL